MNCMQIKVKQAGLKLLLFNRGKVAADLSFGQFTRLFARYKERGGLSLGSLLALLEQVGRKNDLLAKLTSDRSICPARV